MLIVALIEEWNCDFYRIKYHSIMSYCAIHVTKNMTIGGHICMSSQQKIRLTPTKTWLQAVKKLAITFYVACHCETKPTPLKRPTLGEGLRTTCLISTNVEAWIWLRLSPMHQSRWTLLTHLGEFTCTPLLPHHLSVFHSSCEND